MAIQEFMAKYFRKNPVENLNRIKQRITQNVNTIDYNPKAIFNSEGLESNCGVLRMYSEKGACGLCNVIHTPTEKAYSRLLEFTGNGGKLIYMPMLAGLPEKEDAPMYSLIGYATAEPADYLKEYNLTEVFDGCFLPIGRFYPVPGTLKKFDFLIVTWAGDIKHKRWDLVPGLIKKLCPEHTMCIIAYKGVPSRAESDIIDKYTRNGKLVFINEWVPKDEYPALLNSSRVMIIPSEWDNKPRIMDQALLCNIPLAVNSNIYGGSRLITPETGKLAPPESLADRAKEVLASLAGKTVTRDWYLENHGPYNATLELVERVNEIFDTDHKVLYSEGKKFMFLKKYVINCKIPKEQEKYFLSLNL